ncbi:MAG: glycosyltransferase family 2 protein [Ilumatobacteraceae bacterium]
MAAFVTALFQRICATRVSLDDIGAFDALLAVVGGVGVLGLGLQVVLARLPGDAHVPAGVSLGVGLIVGGLVVVGMPVSGSYAFGVGGLTGAATTATFCGIAARARLLLRADWHRLAVVYVTGAAVRLAVIVPLLGLIGKSVTAALAATFVAEAVMSATAVLLAPSPLGRQRYDRATLRRLLGSVVMLAGLWALIVLDTVLGRVRLPAGEADAYSLGTTVARSSFFMALLLTHLPLPTFMRERGRSQRVREVFSTAMVAIVAGAGAVGVVVVAAPRWLARVVLGDVAGVVDVSTLRLLAAAWAAMSVIPLLTYFHLDRHRRLAAVPLVGAVALAVAGLIVRTNDSLAAVTLVVFVVCVGAMALPAIQRLAPVTRSVAWSGSSMSVAVDSQSDIAMIVPFFNPGRDALLDTVRRLAATLDGLDGSYRIVAVSDGSTDGSPAALRDLGLAHVEVIELPNNAGKGAALRVGFAISKAAYVGYIDADGDLPPEQLSDLVRIAATSGADAVVGSKVHPDSKIATLRHRTAMSRLFRVTVRLLFRLDVRDTQTGLKLYRGEVIAAVGPVLHENGFAIDVEILVAARRDGQLTIVEAPVQIISSAKTTVSARRALASGVGLLRIFWRNHVALLYDPVPPMDDPRLAEVQRP